MYVIEETGRYDGFSFIKEGVFEFEEDAEDYIEKYGSPDHDKYKVLDVGCLIKLIEGEFIKER